MLKFIKKLIPKQIKYLILRMKAVTIDVYRKKKLAEKMRMKHQVLLKNIKTKKKIKVVFLVIHESVWKVDTIFIRMLKDSLFEPKIIVCPYIPYGEERMLEDMDQAYKYFKSKGYPLEKSLREDGSWIKLKEIAPDIIFFTNPHNITRKEYYEDAYLNYLSCYVPYYFMATKHVGDENIELNNDLFISAWKLFWANDYTKKLNQEVSVNKGVNGYSYGYPAVENMFSNSNHSRDNYWKMQTTAKKRIIFAPHHTIDDSNVSLSSFLLFGEAIMKIATTFQNEVQWSFKPHPILKPKLYLHPNWGKAKTDTYYSFWEKQTFTQLDEGEYEGLFLSSDSLIHDCSSFIVEYAFTGKPCLFLVNKNDLKDLLNEFGEGVMQLYEQAKVEKEIESFVSRLVNEAILPDKSKRAYFESYVEEYYKEKLPSERIVEDIKQSLGVLNVK